VVPQLGDGAPRRMRRIGSVGLACAIVLLVAAPAAASDAAQPGPKPRLESCKEAKPDGMCGTVTVPLDRTDPSKGTIDIFFLFFPHRDPGPASSAILVTEGGPGLSVTQDQFLRDFYPDIFEPVMDTRDLILLDQRGVGKSGAINCPKLQHAAGPIRKAIRGCGEQLGATASLYASDNVALDIEAVRSALGIDLLDFYGGSNAAVEIQAYAARFPQHLRSAVLDSPVSSIVPNPFDVYSARGWLRAAKLICSRSGSCSAEHRNTERAIAWLAKRLRRHPLEGVGRDASGERHEVRVTEGVMLWSLLGSDAGGHVAPSEIGAAAQALRRGDRRPLLRLAAENSGPFFGDEGKAIQFSAGESFARYCNDNPMPWDKSAARSVRKEQYEAARAALPSDTFRPFSVSAWLAPVPIGPLGPDACIDWPAPFYDIPSPIPVGAQLPGNVPALVLTGDIDLSTVSSTARLLADAWPNSNLVKIRNAAHHTATPLGGRYECADAIIVAFIADLAPGHTGCASKVGSVLPAVGRFAEKASQARQAARARGDHSTATGRRVTTVAVAAVTDAIRRNFLFGNAGPGVGLRGGKFEVRLNDAGNGIVGELDKVRFARDVAVSGRVRYGFESEVLRATVKVRGPHGERGRLRISGLWFAFFHDASTFAVHGTLGRHRISLRVPAT
jgi:pimeloyl-ACP methyl ester carboxylesterase